jgi:hypothetical protein
MIRDISFTRLKEEGVPDEVLQALHNLKDRLKKSKRKFLEALQDTLEPIWLDQYRDLILRYAFYDTQPRKEEYDVEHLESALEANADFFLTDDDVLIGRVKRAAERYRNFAYQRANEICMHPVEALPRLLTL